MKRGGYSRFILIGLITMGAISAVSPSTKPMFAILLPITLPIANSGDLSKAARMATASSGADVPKAITVAPITKELSLRKRARRALPVIRKSPP